MVIPRDLYGLARLPFAGVFERHQVAALRGAGMDVGVLSAGVITARHLGRRIPYAPVDLFDGVVVYRAPRRAYVPARWESPLDAARRSYRTAGRAFEQYVKTQGRPDVIHAHNHASGGALARLIHDDYGIPYVITEHSSIYMSDPRAVARAQPAIASASEKAALVIAVSNHLAQHLRPILRCRRCRTHGGRPQCRRPRPADGARHCDGAVDGHHHRSLGQSRSRQELRSVASGVRTS